MGARMRRGLFGLKIKFDNEPIVDQKVKNIKELDNIIQDVKKKFE